MKNKYVYSDGWRRYDGLVDIGYDKYFRIHHGKSEFVGRRSHINGIESFWSYAKIRLVKFRGVDKRPKLIINLSDNNSTTGNSGSTLVSIINYLLN